jgi:hypothetical protein
MVITGFDTEEKGHAFADALLRRTRRLFGERGLGEYRDTAVHLIGAETLWGSQAAAKTREITVRIDVRHNNRDALELFSKETSGAALAMTTGRCSAGAAGRPKVTPVIAQFSFLVDKQLIKPLVTVGEQVIELPALKSGDEISVPVSPTGSGQVPEAKTTVDGGSDTTDTEFVDVPLIALAVARSGDKGNNANIGVMARSGELLPWILRAITAERVHHWFAHTVEGDVTRFELPGFQAMNFMLMRCLGGGGTSSLHLDHMAKTYAQQLLTMPVAVPVALANSLLKPTDGGA